MKGANAFELAVTEARYFGKHLEARYVLHAADHRGLRYCDEDRAHPRVRLVLHTLVHLMLTGPVNNVSM